MRKLPDAVASSQCFLFQLCQRLSNFIKVTTASLKAYLTQCFYPRGNLAPQTALLLAKIPEIQHLWLVDYFTHLFILLYKGRTLSRFHSAPQFGCGTVFASRTEAGDFPSSWRGLFDSVLHILCTTKRDTNVNVRFPPRRWKSDMKRRQCHLTLSTTVTVSSGHRRSHKHPSTDRRVPQERFSALHRVSSPACVSDRNADLPIYISPRQSAL